MVTMTWGRRPPAAGSDPVARAVLAALTRPSRSCWGRVRRSRSPSPPMVPSLPSAASDGLRGLVAVFITVRRGSYWSGVAKNSTCCSPRRGFRMNTPCRWRSSSSEGSLPSWSIASVHCRAMRVTKSVSCSAAVRVRACSIRAMVSSVAWCRTRSRARLMMVADREPTDPDATAAASSGRSGSWGWPVIPVRGSTASARASRRRASPAPIRSLIRRNSVVFRHPSSAGSGSFVFGVAAGISSAASLPASAGWASVPAAQPRGPWRSVSLPHPVVQPTAAPRPAPERAA
ncbi:hypothetical protein D9M72_463530 [compost metagenome]